MPNENENRTGGRSRRPTSVGGMARRLANPAHLADLARRSAATLREQGDEQLWRDVTFRVGLAFHYDSWRHRADIPLRRELKEQRAANLQGPTISVVLPVYNTPLRFFKQMVSSVQRQTYRTGSSCLSMLRTATTPSPARLPSAGLRKTCGFFIKKWKTSALPATRRPGLRWRPANTSFCLTMTTCFIRTRCLNVCRSSKRRARILSIPMKLCSTLR